MVNCIFFCSSRAWTPAPLPQIMLFSHFFEITNCGFSFLSLPQAELLLFVKLWSRSKPNFHSIREQSAAQSSFEIYSRCWQCEDFFQNCRWWRPFLVKYAVSVWAGKLFSSLILRVSTLYKSKTDKCISTGSFSDIQLHHSLTEHFKQ